VGLEAGRERKRERERERERERKKGKPPYKEEPGSGYSVGGKHRSVYIAP